MPTTPNYSFPYPLLTDAPNAPTQLENLAEAVDTEILRVDGDIADNTSDIAQLDGDLSDVAGGTDGSHVWTGSRAVGDTSGTYSSIINLTQSRSAGIATLGSSTNITLNRAGKWALTVVASSDAGSAGVMKCKINWSSGPLVGGGIEANAWNGSGFGGAGRISFGPTWTGWVTSGQASSSLQIQVGRDSNAGDSATFTVTVYAEFLGSGH